MQALEAELEEHKQKFAVEYREALAQLTPEQFALENAKRAKARKTGKSTRGNLRDPNKPKLPPNGYMLYLSERRSDPDWLAARQAEAEGEKYPFIAVTTKAAAEWREMSADDKAVRGCPCTWVRLRFRV
jgi:hypothetical protein